MAITDIDLGNAPNDGQGDPLRVGGQKINANFDWLNANKIDISKRVQDLLSPNSTDIASTQAIYDALQNISGFNNDIIWKGAVLTVPSNPNVSDVVSAINSSAQFVGTGNEQYYFITYQTVVSSTGASSVNNTSYDIITKIWVLKSGKGTYGTGGTQIDSNDILLISTQSTQNYNPLSFNLGEIGTQNVEDAVNSSGPYGVSEGTTVLFKATRNGDPYTWIWIGTGETIGTGYPPTTASDYLPLNTMTPSPSDPDYQFVSIANFESSLYDEYNMLESNTILSVSLTEKFYLLYDIDDNKYYFASKATNIEDFVNSRIYISADRSKYDLGLPSLTQNGYFYWALGSGITGFSQGGTQEFQAWFHTQEIDNLDWIISNW